jgi:2-hydroxychromene-2-carboxylate isomerase
MLCAKRVPRGGVILKVEFWFDFASTYSYVAAMRAPALFEGAGIELAYKPFLLGPIFTALLGIKDSPFNVQPVRGQYMWRDLERLCEKHSLPWRRPSVFPRNSVLAARVALAADSGDVVGKLFHANFALDVDISSDEALASLVGPTLVEKAQTPEVKQQLRDNTSRAQQLGIFGAPNFVIGSELFFGQDRLEDAIAWVKARRGSPPPAAT